MTRVRRRRTQVGLGFVAVATLLTPSSADAQDPTAPTLGGFQGSATASGVHAFYNPVGLLPLSAPVDLGAPDAVASIASGPSTFARASVADPGDLLANPDALLQAAVGADYPAGSVPKYPFRISASSGVGEPEIESNPAPGLNARVAADPSGSRAEATTPQLSAPAIVTLGTASSTATTTTDGSTVTVHARTSLGGFSLLGLLTIDAVVTDLTAASDGTTTKLNGGTVITGASILGQPITIDANGIRSTNGSGTPNPLVGAIDEVLATLGIHVAVASPVKLGDEQVSQLSAAGLHIDLEISDRTLPALGDLLALIPPVPPLAPGVPGVDDLLAVAQARHLGSIQIAGASVALTARPTAPEAVIPDDPPVDLSPSTPTFGATPTFPSSPGVSLNPSTAPGLPTSTNAPAPTLAQGIGAIALLALLIQPFLGDRLARGAGLLTSAGLTDTCPREGT